MGEKCNNTSALCDVRKHYRSPGVETTLEPSQKLRVRYGTLNSTNNSQLLFKWFSQPASMRMPSSRLNAIMRKSCSLCTVDIIASKLTKKTFYVGRMSLPVIAGFCRCLYQPVYPISFPAGPKTGVVVYPGRRHNFNFLCTDEFDYCKRHLEGTRKQ